ncbi:DNA methyltransferase [Acidocella sp.]|uniref:class I SAM-dependent DNA methyltransferase n=1 Tax=Acidocella sp. TaxID=50710 RepID=UPI0026231B8C|nr:DNA methyltransferase [Acidocella sp.]
MNAVEIEQAISALAEQPFDPAEFPYAFLEAFGNKETTIRRLRKGESNKSDLGGVLQTNNIHIAVSPKGDVTKTLMALKASPATSRGKAKFVLATDGSSFEAEDLSTGETVACEYTAFPDHFGFFLPLAGISTVKQIRESSFDIRATGRLNKLYIELLKDNADWGAADRRHDMNHFMARLIFCFFAEDTDIFSGTAAFTATIERMSAKDSSNTHEVISDLFRAMNTKVAERSAAGIPRWADAFPYVNGGLFSGNTDVPRFSKIARTYLIHIGNLDWKKINPDIFGSMIQAVADDDERGSLGMHYTSVPNILKVLNPLFLDDLRNKLQEAGENPRVLLNLRKRMARIRVFDPACGSGNFLVIAYKEMRSIEAEINKRRGEALRASDIPLTNFRGIELRDFPAEIARLALIIAEYQCDVLYRGQKEALADFLPLDAENWITCGNALRLDWLTICPPTGTGVKHHADDLFHMPLDQVQIDFENEGGETYICGNPPFLGSTYQTKDQKSDLAHVFSGSIQNFAAFDYVFAWFFKSAIYLRNTPARAALVSTNSICQGYSVSSFWPFLLQNDLEIGFAHRSFKWKNNASHNAAVICAIIGLRSKSPDPKTLYDDGLALNASNINAYLVNAPDVYVEGARASLFGLPCMDYGNKPVEGGNLILELDEARAISSDPRAKRFIRPFKGSQEVVKGLLRFCLWVDDASLQDALEIPEIRERIARVREVRLNSPDKYVVEKLAARPHAFKQVFVANSHAFLVPRHTSENRPYLPADIVTNDTICSDAAMALYDAPCWAFAIFSSRIHLAWISAVCGKIKTDFRYSNTLGWNTFPVPTLTEKNKADLARCAENILLTREAHFPATIADLYDPEAMPADLRAAHDYNDEVLERIYIGRRFKNDTERLEKLFELYTRATSDPKKAPNLNKKVRA